MRPGLVVGITTIQDGPGTLEVFDITGRCIRSQRVPLRRGRLRFT